MKIHIREATWADLPAIKEKTIETGWNDLLPEQKERLSRQEIHYQVGHLFDRLIREPKLNSKLFVAKDQEGRYVGHIWLGESVDTYTGKRRGFIFDLYVVEEHRKQGIGQSLMARAERIGRQRGYTTIGLMVAPHNRGAISLYEKLGYRTERLAMVKLLP
ncbi:MAG: GNAT family N-acetyltransferase [Anaerolineae bacterium]